MSQATAEDRLEPSSVSVEFFCHICGSVETDRICSASEVAAHIKFLRRFHRSRLRHPTESALQDRVNFTQEYITHVESCRRCGLVCRAPRPPADAITGTYSEDRYGREHLESEFRLQREWAETKVMSLQARLPDVGSRAPLVVEVGSFVGGFLAAGLDRDWKMMGIDPGKEVTSFCLDRGWDVFCGTLIEASIGRRTVDAVAIWNTFDQLPHPDATLSASREILREQGILVIRVPNGACFRRLMDWHRQAAEPLKSWVMGAMAWNNLLGFPYVYGYTVRTLDQLLARHGFARIEVVPDTLMPLADDSSTTWARWEERVMKWTCTVAARVEQVRGVSDYQFAPWLDVYYRVAQSVPDTALSVARVPEATGIPR
jgi:hypothetical protein